MRRMILGVDERLDLGFLSPKPFRKYVCSICVGDAVDPFTAGAAAVRHRAAHGLFGRQVKTAALLGSSRISRPAARCS